ncbi:cytochrome P450 [Microdochium bolleyi]|uniref:Cytochrome P450 n=1 Tax=Microdochium bolleyi TaxID=196109 RepID=A0A136IXN2_9PEZI|nr:cytochrome P450 [Microdochium bolleyi]
MANSRFSRFLALLALVVFTSSFVSRRRRGKEQPRKLPLIGDLHQSPADKPLLNWNAWAARHGPVAVVNLLFGTFVPLVVLNTADAAAYFFSRKGGHCNNRPHAVSLELLTGIEEKGQSRFLLLHDYDANYKLRHRILAPSLGPLAAPKWHAVLALEVRQMLVDIVKLSFAQEKPDFVLHRDEIHPPLERAIGSAVLAMHYGIRVPDVTDPTYTRMLEQHDQFSSVAANPWLVDLAPFLRHLPLLISPWRRAAKVTFEEQKAFNVGLLQRARLGKSWNAARQADAILASMHRPLARDVSDIDLAYVLATSVEGAMEATSRQALWLLVAAATNSDCQRKAHEILDITVGRHRLPRFSDRNGLAYIEAFVAETLRWRPILPISIPRRTQESDEYKGVSVGQGVNIVGNTWAIGRDPLYASTGAVNSNVEAFVPERWLNFSGTEGMASSSARMRSDLSVPLFGHGRRGCPGQKVALDALYLQAAVLLWAFDIKVAEGEKIDLMAMEASRFMALPPPCKLVLKPRGDWSEETIKAEWDGHEKDVDVLLGAFSS